MADISQDLQKILDAIYGEEVRGSIYHAISLINDVSEVILTTGTDITAPTDSSEGYYTGSLYLNLDTYELWKCVGTNAWQSLGILKGATGDNGNKWYRGLAVSGKAVLPTVYPTGIANANANDCYLNPSEGAIYHCVTGGDDTTATWSYDFTMTGGGGGGSIVAWTQIQGATGGVKIAEIDIDGSMQEVYAPEGGGGGMLPYLYIDSEAGATVTVNQPDGTTITPTAAGSGHWECELTGGYGTYVIHSVLSGQGDATQSLVVDTVMEYHVTDTHYDHAVSFVAPSGSTVRIEGGTEIYTLTGTGSTQTQVVHSASTSFTVTATMDGNGKPYTFTTPSTSGQTTTIPSGTFDFGTINVSVGADFVTAGSTITCVNGGTSCTPKTAASTLVFRVPTTGTWTISGTVSGQTYTTTATITALGTPVSTSLQTIPEGSTVLPTDDIPTWLACGGLSSTGYTTLSQVLADSTTLLALMSYNNAVDYLVRSTTWATDVCADSTAMTDIGANNYCADTLLADTDWNLAIAASTYVDSVLNVKVPTLSSSSTGASAENHYGTDDAWKAFDNDDATNWFSSYVASLNESKTAYIQYEFTDAVRIVNLYIKDSLNAGYPMQYTNLDISGSTDGITFTPIYTYNTAFSDENSIAFTNSGTYKYYRVNVTAKSGYNGVQCPRISTLQFYGREDV